MTASAVADPAEPLHVPRYETEIPLLILVAVLSLSLWVFLVISIIGIVYAVFFGVFFLLMHAGFVAHLRGSAVRLGPDQMPELYARVEAISRKLGMKETPEAYLMQAGGSLNALATKFFSSSFIVLFSDLLEACGDDTEAADFVIAHEIGHLKAGHLRFRWFLILGRLVPFVGTAWSRACEYTADRYGFMAVPDRSAAVRGLTVLAAGGRFAGKVNMDAFVAQRSALDTVMMNIGHWMSTHPALAYRIAEVDQQRFPKKSPASGPMLAAIGLILGVMIVPPAAVGAFFAFTMFKASDLLSDDVWSDDVLLDSSDETVEEEPPVATDTAAEAELRAQVQADFESLARTAEEYKARTGRYPENSGALHAAYQLINGTDAPQDPYDGEPYGYSSSGEAFYMFSAGGEDLTWDSTVQTVATEK